jgi:hypothetical protein
VLGLVAGVLSASSAEAASTAEPYDFNGDGYPELVVGAPNLQVGPVVGAGGVVVLPASARGLSLNKKFISQPSRGVPGPSADGDRFGEAVASADFDRDGYADLAVGQPRDAAGTVERVGAVTVIYGSSRGLDTCRSRRINPTFETGKPSPEVYFGAALAAGDFDSDGFPDLAIGAPYADLEGRHGLDPSGRVTVVSGGSTGLSSSAPVMLRRQGGAAPDSGFGAELAAGDLDRDGGTDLIVYSAGYPQEDHVGASYPGSLSYCPGRVGGPTGCVRLVHDQAYAGTSGVGLAVGNMSGDFQPEIVVGLPYSDSTGRNIDSPSGDVRILQLRAGSPLRVAHQHRLTQDSRGVPGGREGGDRFGSSVALGDIDRDGYADLAVGAIGENFSEGRVTVVHGAATGWRTSGNYFHSQSTPGIPGLAESFDHFGGDVSLRDHNRDGRLDLTVSANGENGAAGAITTLRGSGRGFTTTGARTFGLATLGHPHPAEALFGATLGRK